MVLLENCFVVDLGLKLVACAVVSSTIAAQEKPAAVKPSHADVSNSFPITLFPSSPDTNLTVTSESE